MQPNAWQRSSFCTSGACVEVSTQDDSRLMRQSDTPDGMVLDVDGVSWREFLHGVKAGEFD